MRRMLIPLLCLSSLSFAFELPLASPHARVTQTIGLTEITVEYSSPAVRGRPIWGALVPWDQPWRAGANAPTRVSFGRDVSIHQTVVPAGTYALTVIPRKTGAWTLVLGDSPPRGEPREVVRVDAAPERIAHRERLTYLFADFSDDAGTLELEWAEVRLSLPIRCDTPSQLAAGLAELDHDTWHTLNDVAVYELDHKDYDAALRWVEKSLRQSEDWFNVWTKARILAARGARREAGVWARRAQQLGVAQKAPGYRNHLDEVDQAIRDWK